MTEVIFFSHHNTTPWWQFLAENLNCTSSSAVMSDLREPVDFCIVNDFYHHLKNQNCEQIAIDHFSEEECASIIKRCRVLRNLKKSLALSMIGSMWLTLDALIKKEKPKLIVSFIMDRYLFDVLGRITQEYNIKFVEMTASIIPDHVMLMERGKLIKFRDPEPAEIDKSRTLLINESFTPSYVSKSKKYNNLLFWRTFLYFKLRGLAFDLIRYLKRDKLNIHYLDAKNSLNHKPRLLDYKVKSYMDDTWEHKLSLTPKDKRVFIGLQLLPEASLDYWLEDLSLLNNEELILKVCHVLGKEGYVIFVKDHPLQFGFRKREVIQKLAALSYVVLVPYEVPATLLIKECPVTVTCTGTIGFQSALAGSCSVVSNAYYSDQEHFVHFNNLMDIEGLPEKIKLFQMNNSRSISEKGIDKLLNNVLSASMPGDLFSFRKFDKNNQEHINRVLPLLDSMNKYFPEIMREKDKVTSEIKRKKAHQPEVSVSDSY
ncbi:MAG: hypothetical protein Q8M40_13445 [Legionella sp.]|nr:hypothetical protein [Legionella sp.]